MYLNAGKIDYALTQYIREPFHTDLRFFGNNHSIVQNEINLSTKPLVLN